MKKGTIYNLLSFITILSITACLNFSALTDTNGDGDGDGDYEY